MWRTFTKRQSLKQHNERRSGESKVRRTGSRGAQINPQRTGCNTVSEPPRHLVR